MDRAFERLYRRHVLDVYRYTLVLLHSPEDAEDVTQTAFLNAYRAYARGERPPQPRNWLIGLAHVLCEQRFRHESAGATQVELDDLEEALPEEDEPTAEDVRRALDRLPFNERAALVMREVEARTYREIAEILGVSVGAVETLVFGARRALREHLEGRLTCHEAERAVSRQLDGRLARSDRGTLREHLRDCDDCASLGRSQLAQREALRSLAQVALPKSLSSFFEGSAGAEAAALVAGGHTE